MTAAVWVARCGSMTGVSVPVGVPIAVGSERFVTLSAGGDRSCGITSTGTTYCWGRGTQASDTSTRPAVISGPPFATVSVGEINTCALTPSGATFCWQGLTGSPTQDGAFLGAVDSAPILSHLSVGDPICGVAPSGVGYCWGWNGYGVLGNGATATTAVPSPVSGGLTWGNLTASFESHTCGVTTSGAAYCWGWNVQGQLGLDTTVGPQQCVLSAPCSTTPAAVTGGLTFTAVSAGDYHTCGLTSSGAAYCWGQNIHGQLGIGSATGPQQCVVPGGPLACSTTPVQVAGGGGFTALSAGGNHTCALTQSGATYCWGWNAYGQLGIGSTMDSSVPTAVTGGLLFVAISAGENHTCGLTQSGGAYCWGATMCGTGPGTYNCSGVP